MSTVEVARKIKQSQDVASPTQQTAAHHTGDVVPAAPITAVPNATLINENTYSSQAQPLNQELRSNLEDSRCVATELHKDMLATIGQCRAQWNSWCDHNGKLANEFDAGYQHPTPTGIDVAHLDDKFQLGCNTAWLETYGGLSHDPVKHSEESFDSLKNPGCGLQARDDARRNIASLSKQLYPLGEFSLPQHTMSMNEFHHADPLVLLRTDLSKSFKLVAGLEAQTAQTLEEREVLLRNEDITNAEQKTTIVLQQMSDIIGHVNQRHNKALEARTDVNQFQENFKALVASTENEALGKELASLKHKAETDLNTISEGRAEFLQEQSRLQQGYEGRTNTFKERLKNNTHAQHEQWDVVFKALEKLNGLVTERDTLIDEHVSDTVAEKQRQRRCAEFESACNERSEHLQKLTQHVAAGSQLLQKTNEYFGQVLTDIEAADAPGRLTALQQEERLRFYDIYKRYVLFAGTALHRKEQRVENVRRLIRSTEFQIKNAMHSMDTDLPLYKQQLEGMRTNEQQLVTSIAELELAMEENAALWKPVQELLEDQDDADFEPPNLLLQELRRDLMRARVEAIDDLTNTEQKLLDGEKASVRKMQNACEATKTVLTERRQTRKSAKESIAAGTSPSASPLK